jgi:hypothetical protein
MLDATDRLTKANFGIVRCTCAAITRRLVMSTRATDSHDRFSESAIALLGTDSPELILGVLRLCTGFALVYSKLPGCLEAYSNFIHIFQEHVRTFFRPSLFSDARVHFLGRRVISVCNLAVSHMFEHFSSDECAFSIVSGLLAIVAEPTSPLGSDPLISMLMNNQILGIESLRIPFEYWYNTPSNMPILVIAVSQFPNLYGQTSVSSRHRFT